MTQKKAVLKSFDLTFDRGYVGRTGGERCALSLELELTPEAADAVADVIAKALHTPSRGFCQMTLNAPAVNGVALDGLLEVLSDSSSEKYKRQFSELKKVTQLENRVQDLEDASVRHANEKARLEEAVRDWAESFEACERAKQLQAAKLEARIVELQKALNDAADAFEAIEFGAKAAASEAVGSRKKD